MTSTMLADKGAAYTVRWPHVIAEQLGISVEYVAQAYKTVTGGEVDRAAFYSSERTGEPVAEIGALTGEQAKALVGAMRDIVTEIKTRRHTHCQTCGLELRASACPECGDQSVVGDILGSY